MISSKLICNIKVPLANSSAQSENGLIGNAWEQRYKTLAENKDVFKVETLSSFKFHHLFYQDNY